MNPVVLDAVAAAQAKGVDVGALIDTAHVREINGAWIVAPNADALDATRVDILGAEGTVILLTAGARIKALSIRGEGHVLAIGASAQLSGIVMYGARNLATVGANTMLSMSTIVRGTDNRLHIGHGCVGVRGTIRTSDDHTIFDAQSGDPINRARDVRIGDRVYLGRNVRVSKGADIGDGVVVAPDSVVTGKLQAGGYYGGVPARLIKANVTWKARA